jgi:hypothetical protein
MARKKEEETETGLAVVEEDDMMVPVIAPTYGEDDAGLGSEDVGAGDVILPRVSLLQGLSTAVAEDLPGAKAGVYWLTPANRPLGKPGDPIRFTVVRIYPTQRLWTPLNEGGGIICEAPDGKLIASNPFGLTDAELDISIENGVATGIEWRGGEPTDRCAECVYGPGASAALSGRKNARGGGSGWLPKVIERDGQHIRLSDELRAPRCTQGLDALVLVAVPEFNDPDSGISLPRDIMPAFITFTRTSFSAGRSLAGQIKTAAREPAWSRVFALGAKKVTNDKGTFFVSTVQQLGFSSQRLLQSARELYDATSDRAYRPAMDGVQEETSSGHSHAEDSIAKPPSDDEPAPDDSF